MRQMRLARPTVLVPWFAPNRSLKTRCPHSRREKRWYCLNKHRIRRSVGSTIKVAAGESYNFGWFRVYSLPIFHPSTKSRCSFRLCRADLFLSSPERRVCYRPLERNHAERFASKSSKLPPSFLRFSLGTGGLLSSTSQQDKFRPAWRGCETGSL
jgi:hypothetical protein